MVGNEHPTGSAATIEIQIDELVLYGFAAVDRNAIREAVAAELARLLNECGTTRSDQTLSQLGQSFELAQLKAGSFQLASNAPAGRIGAQVAGALWNSIIRSKETGGSYE